MKSTGKGIFLLFCVFSFFALTAVNPSKVLAGQCRF